MQLRLLVLFLLVPTLIHATITTGHLSAQEEVEVVVDEGQIATVSGRSESLQAVIEDLCASAGVHLLSFDAEDRPIVAGYEKIALHELLPRLLKEESYFVGLRAGPQGETRVATLRVIGQNRSGAPLTPPTDLRAALDSMAEQRPAPAFQIPPALLRSSFNSENTATRERAAKYVRERLLGNVGQSQRFISMDSETLGRVLRPYKYAGDILTQVRDLHDDAAVKIKLNDIIRAMERPQ